MSIPIKTLISQIDDDSLGSIFENTISYVSPIKNEQYIENFQFDGTNFDGVIDEAEKSIKLQQACRIKDDTVEILKLLNKFGKSLLLNQADHILISKRDGHNCFKIDNISNPNTGVIIMIVINSLRDELLNHIQKRRDAQTNQVWLGTGVVISIILLYKLIYNQK
jgi:hypothetical protein